MDTRASLVHLSGVTKNYGPLTAVSDFSLDLPAGKIIGILGPNGSGKTTIIKMMAGLLVPTAGDIRIDGSPVGEKTKAIVSYLPERNSLPLFMSPEELITFFSDMFPDFDAEKCRSMLKDLGVGMKQPIRHLSKGTKEKVQLIMVMSRHAKLYILDEPIAGVDPAARDYIMETIFRHRDPESTLLISTHLIRDVEEVLDEFVFIKRGLLMCYDAVQNLHEKGQTVDGLFREVFRWEA